MASSGGDTTFTPAYRPSAFGWWPTLLHPTAPDIVLAGYFLREDASSASGERRRANPMLALRQIGWVVTAHKVDFLSAALTSARIIKLFNFFLSGIHASSLISFLGALTSENPATRSSPLGDYLLPSAIGVQTEETGREQYHASPAPVGDPAPSVFCVIPI
jgi:hypothetical protein